MRAVDLYLSTLEQIEALEDQLFDNCMSAQTLRTRILTGSECLIEEVDGCVVGYVLFNADGGYCDIARLAVAPAHQGKGIGTKLLAAVPSGPATLCVRRSNTAALRLYRRNGFTIVGWVDDSWVLSRS